MELDMNCVNHLLSSDELSDEGPAHSFLNCEPFLGQEAIIFSVNYFVRGGNPPPSIHFLDLKREELSRRGNVEGKGNGEPKCLLHTSCFDLPPSTFPN